MAFSKITLRNMTENELRRYAHVDEGAMLELGRRTDADNIDAAESASALAKAEEEIDSLEDDIEELARQNEALEEPVDSLRAGFENALVLVEEMASSGQLGEAEANELQQCFQEALRAAFGEQEAAA